MGERAGQTWARGLATCGVCALVLCFGSPAGAASQARSDEIPSDTQRPLAPTTPDHQKPLGLPRTGITPPSAAPAGAESSSVLQSVLRTGLSLGAVLALLWLCGYVFKRVSRGSGSLWAAVGPGGKAPSGVLEVLGRFPLSRGLTLILLRVDRRILLLSQSGGLRASASLGTLCEIDDPEQVASLLAKVRESDGDSIAGRFAAALGQAEKLTSRAMGPGGPPPTSGAEPAQPPARRREVVSSAGDRAELWEVRPPVKSRGYAPLPPMPSQDFETSDRGPARESTPVGPPTLDSASEALRKRLMALRPRDPGAGSERP